MKFVKKVESGRSMVEMLGVLAIVGILSVTGVTGYTLAMNKRRANDILDGASKRAMTVSTQMMLKAPINLDEFAEADKLSGGTFGSTVVELDNDQFALLIDDVSKNTCITLIKSIHEKTPLRDITTQGDMETSLEAENCQTKNNQLALIFNKDLANKSMTSSLSGGNSSSSGGGTLLPEGGSSSSSGGEEPEGYACSSPNGHLGDKYCDNMGGGMQQMECTGSGWTLATDWGFGDPCVDTVDLGCSDPDGTNGETRCVYGGSYPGYSKYLCQAGTWIDITNPSTMAGYCPLE